MTFQNNCVQFRNLSVNIFSSKELKPCFSHHEPGETHTF